MCSTARKPISAPRCSTSLRCGTNVLDKTPIFDEPAGVVLRLTVWSLVMGCLMYCFSLGWVFDRYVLGWAVLLPIAWVRVLPRSLLIVQIVGLLTMLIFQTTRLLM